MIRRGPIERYLGELRRRLPYPAPRFLAEAEEHLLQATADHVREGVDHAEAERLAIAGYGPVDDVVSAVLSEGSPLMSPRLVRLIVPVAVLLSMPTAVFVSANLIEELAGTAGSSGIFGSTFDSWRSTITGLIVFGPMVALALIVLTSVRLRRDRGAAGFAATVELKMTRAVMWAAIVVSIVAASVVGYGIAENYGEWRDFHNANWTCTSHQGRTVCYEGLLGPDQVPGLAP